MRLTGSVRGRAYKAVQSREGAAVARWTRAGHAGQKDLFSSAGAHTSARLAGLSWPAQARFAVNQSTARVHSVLWPEVAGSPPLLVTRCSSLDELIAVLWAWGQGGHPGPARLRPHHASTTFRMRDRHQHLGATAPADQRRAG
jgi:hypothetical protein